MPLQLRREVLEPAADKTQEKADSESKALCCKTGLWGIRLVWG